MHTVHIRAFPPYRAWLDGQSELVLQVEGPIGVRELWARLASTYPRFGQLLAYGTDEELSRALIVLQNGHLLGPADLIEPDTPVELLPSIAGGGWKQNRKREILKAENVHGTRRESQEGSQLSGGEVQRTSVLGKSVTPPCCGPFPCWG